MKIGEFDIRKKVMVIAEIGNNHEGNYSCAREMIIKAAEAGADAVKFQTFKTEAFVGRQNKERFETLKKFELTQDEFRRLKECSDESGVLFLSTPFELESAEFINELVPAFKIASGDNTFYPLIDTVANFGKPILLSCGLASMNELNLAKERILARWKEKDVLPGLAVLHCVTSYPVPPEEANLKMIRALHRELGCITGYSDHCLGIDAAVYSVAAGARIVEKHFTLDKNHSKFRDHQLSADPKDLKDMVQKISLLEQMMGEETKVVQECEKAFLIPVRRSIVAKNNLNKGQVISMEDIVWLRPGGGIPPGKEDFVVGRVTKRNVQKGDMISLDDLS